MRPFRAPTVNTWQRQATTTPSCFGHCPRQPLRRSLPTSRLCDSSPAITAPSTTSPGHRIVKWWQPPAAMPRSSFGESAMASVLTPWDSRFRNSLQWQYGRTVVRSWPAAVTKKSVLGGSNHQIDRMSLRWSRSGSHTRAPSMPCDSPNRADSWFHWARTTASRFGMPNGSNCWSISLPTR